VAGTAGICVPWRANHSATRSGSSLQTCAGSTRFEKQWPWSQASSQATNVPDPRPQRNIKARPAAVARRIREALSCGGLSRRRTSVISAGLGSAAARPRSLSRSARSNSTCAVQDGHPARCASTAARVASSSAPST